MLKLWTVIPTTRLTGGLRPLYNEFQAMPSIQATTKDMIPFKDRTENEVQGASLCGDRKRITPLQP